MTSPRYITQKILTGAWQDLDFPLKDVEVIFPLSGPDIVKGKVGPEIPRPRMPAADPLASWIHVEDAGEIRASGIMQPIAIRDGEDIAIDAEGIVGYPHGIPYLGEFSLGSPIGVNIDPLDVVRNIWNHIQSYSEGNLGVTVDSTTSPVRIGTPKDDSGNAPTEETSGPYTIDWWEGTDCGNEINTLAKETPFDFRGVASWNATKTAVTQRIQLGYPRLGRKRHDLRFRDDENILEAIPLEERPDLWASQIVVRGAGEGRDAIQGYAGHRIGDRIRRVARIQDKSIRSVARANAIGNDELLRRQAFITIGRIVINAKHTNAPIGSFAPGDDIFVQGYVPWVEETYIWHRILSIAWKPEEDIAILTLATSDSFRYGALA